MIFNETAIKGAYVIDPERRGDERGFFARMFCVREFTELGLETVFVQQNISRSKTKGTLRGMHFQTGEHAETKLIRCVRGAVYDVLIDLRPESLSYRTWISVELSDDNCRTLYAPKGVAHGFQTLTDDVEMTYLHSAFYAPGAEGGVRFDDPAFGVAWPLPPTAMTDRDRNWAAFKD